MDDAAAVASEKRRREEPQEAGAEAMEDAAAASSSQKRRRDEPESEEPPARRDGGSGEDAGLDLISELPVEILGVILSHLPSTKGAARTAILSSRWRRIWRSTPLNLTVNEDLAGQARNRITAVSEILAAHDGPVRRLSLETIRLGRDRDAKFDGWFRSPALNGLEELQFYGYGTPPRRLPLRPLPLPPSALRCATTLRAASIGGCDFPEINALSFPVLKRLKLYDVCISEAAIHGLLAGCTVLDSLHLQDIYGLTTVRVVSPTLRCIGVSVFWETIVEPREAFQELVIEDAPCLERMMQVGSVAPRKIKVIAVPKLTVLGYLSGGYTKLAIGALIVQEMIAIPFTWSVLTVKILVLESISYSGDAFVEFLGCFSSLEKLYIQSYLEKVRQNSTLVDPIECLDLQLREIVLNGYRGKKRDVNFAKFFLLNAKVLKVMKFGVPGNCDDEWVANQHKQLQLDISASGDVQFSFQRDTAAYCFYNNPHLHDMWMRDSFDSSFCN